MLMTAFVQFRPEGHWELEFQFSEKSNKKKQIKRNLFECILVVCVRTSRHAPVFSPRTEKR